MTKQACPECRKEGKDSSGDNFVINKKDGYKKCFACGYVERLNGLIKGIYTKIADRCISKEVCEKYDIQVAEYTGQFYVDKQPVSVTNHRVCLFNYYKDTVPVKQKIRSFEEKKFMKIVGQTSIKSLFGMHAFTPDTRWPIVITEGEYDAASVFELTGVPAVSVPNGSLSAAGSIKENLNWLLGWKHIVLLFDGDEAGKKATEEAVAAIPVGKVKIGHISEKDANDMAKAGKGEELKKAIWNAEAYRPETIVTVSDIISDILIKPEYGLSLPWEFLNSGIYGLQEHHLYSIIGFSKVGKTEFLKEIIYHLIDKEKQKIGIFSLEQGAASTVQRMVASKIQKPLHLPSNKYWDEGKIRAIAESFKDSIYLYNNASAESISIEQLLINIRYMYYCYGVKVIILDNLTAMCTNPLIDGKLVSDETYAAHVMKKLFTLTRELPVAILLVAHIYESKLNRQLHIPTSVENKANYLAISEEEMNELINKPGLDWATGRMPGLGDVHKMVGRMSDYVIGLARNIVSENEIVRRTLRVKFLATRLGSEYSGREMHIVYDYESGRYGEEVFVR